MKALRLLWLAVMMVFACSKGAPTAPPPPPGIDPSVLVINPSPDSVRLIFVSDQTGLLTTDTVWIVAGATVCTRWTQTFDSLYTRVVDTLPNVTGAWGSVTAPWIHFSQYPYYFQRVVVATTGGGMLQTIDTKEC